MQNKAAGIDSFLVLPASTVKVPYHATQADWRHVGIAIIISIFKILRKETGKSLLSFGRLENKSMVVISCRALTPLPGDRFVCNLDEYNLSKKGTQFNELVITEEEAANRGLNRGLKDLSHDAV